MGPRETKGDWTLVAIGIYTTWWSVRLRRFGVVFFFRSLEVAGSRRTWGVGVGVADGVRSGEMVTWCAHHESSVM